MKKNIRKSEILWTVGLLLLIPIWIGLAPIWYNWYAMLENGVTGNEKYSNIGNETAAKKVTSVQQNW